MMGTLARFLANKGIESHHEVYRAKVFGDIEHINGVLKITRIEVSYDLQIPDDKKQDAQEAFENYLVFCPAAQSVIACIQITLQLKLT